MIRVLVCDDHQIVREGIRQILADASDIALAGEAANGAEAALARARRRRHRRGAARHRDAAARRPRRAASSCARDLPALPVLMLSTYPDRQYAVRCLKLGAAGYLNKSADSEQTRRGHPQGARAAACSSRRRWPSCSPARSASRRRRCTSGCRTASTRCSACSRPGAAWARSPSTLHLAPNTVSTYRARILDKTGVRNDVELALYAVRHDIASM